MNHATTLEEQVRRLANELAKSVVVIFEDTPAECTDNIAAQPAEYTDDIAPQPAEHHDNEEQRAFEDLRFIWATRAAAEAAVTAEADGTADDAKATGYSEDPNPDDQHDEEQGAVGPAPMPKLPTQPLCIRCGNASQMPMLNGRCHWCRTAQTPQNRGAGVTKRAHSAQQTQQAAPLPVLPPRIGRGAALQRALEHLHHPQPGGLQVAAATSQHHQVPAVPLMPAGPHPQPHQEPQPAAQDVPQIQVQVNNVYQHVQQVVFARRRTGRLRIHCALCGKRHTSAYCPNN